MPTRLQDAIRGKISIHALREEGDRCNPVQRLQPDQISIHALREEGDRPLCRTVHRPVYFYPRPPRGGRRRSARRLPSTPNFYPRPPRGGRRRVRGLLQFYGAFLSTPSARRATQAVRHPCYDLRISIHALREEGDPFQSLKVAVINYISIHALREEGDFRRRRWHERWCRTISIHALREEGDEQGTSQPAAAGYFYPRPPRGGRLPGHGVGTTPPGISIHALREEGDQ